jgi:heme/copper-type cytochrome/quinol oxidase subunit 1
MNLQRKLAEIRRKPEHIRLRYTYAAVAISMFFIILLWFFSISSSIKKADLVKKQNVFQDLDTQKKSLQEATSDVKKSLEDLNTNLEKKPTSNSEPIPQNNQSLE